MSACYFDIYNRCEICFSSGLYLRLIESDDEIKHFSITYLILEI
jgi:hypothetical protein